ncbi:RimJ/RimL family protein N-acetyltransferase [Pullulanibacillus pueri]|nr:GNAT family N-acetyltransferase [Pullulanibacillus pueri]MBM7681135.1 RimJ/RimL family protein N-acetyltransferase [Pullulanibacillus pueri]
MNESYTTEILKWRYEKPFDFYNMEATDEVNQEFLSGSYYAIVTENQELVGFFCIGEAAQVPIGHQFGAYDEKCIDIGLGMRPDLTGRGNGAEFFTFILNEVQAHINTTHVPLRLTVATFNERAIHLYKTFGFVNKNEFDSGRALFQTMIKR